MHSSAKSRVLQVYIEEITIEVNVLALLANARQSYPARTGEQYSGACRGVLFLDVAQLAVRSHGYRRAPWSAYWQGHGLRDWKSLGDSLIGPLRLRDQEPLRHQPTLYKYFLF